MRRLTEAERLASAERTRARKRAWQAAHPHTPEQRIKRRGYQAQYMKRHPRVSRPRKGVTPGLKQASAGAWRAAHPDYQADWMRRNKINLDGDIFYLNQLPEEVRNTALLIKETRRELARMRRA